MSYEARLKGIIKSICRLEVNEESIYELLLKDNADLIDDLGFDSFLMVQLVIELEEEFNIEFDMEELDTNVFRKFNKLLDYIETNLKG